MQTSLPQTHNSDLALGIQAAGEDESGELGSKTEPSTGSTSN